MTTRSPEQVRELLAQHLAWNPLPIVPPKYSKVSNGTRAPSFWDLHLHERLILKEIIYLPSLLDTLAALVDEALASLDDDLVDLSNPDLEVMFPSPEDIRKVVPDDLISETAIVDYYKMTTAPMCCSLAGLLELHIPSGILWRKQSPESTKSGSKTKEKMPQKALADGFLEFGLHELDPIFATLSSTKRERLEALHKHIRHLAVSEFKNVFAGSRKVMQEIVSLAGKPFPWRKCTQEENKCESTQHMEDNGMLTVTGVSMGCDATEPLWSLRDVVRDLPEVVPDKSTFCVSCQTNEKDLESFKSKARHTSTDTDEKKAGDIIQQVWAEAVRSDVTFFSVHSGNYELICVRDRHQQTLYISSFINVTKCQNPQVPCGKHDNFSYGKLETGFYMAAIRDAVSRAMRMSAGIEPLFTFRKPAIPDAKLLTMSLTRKRKYIEEQSSVAMYLRFADQLLKYPTVFVRCLNEVRINFSPGTTITLHFDEQYRPRHPVYQASVTLFGRKATFLQKVVAKVADLEASSAKLVKEHFICTSLGKHGVKGITSVLGLYENVDAGIVVLVTEYAGAPFTGREPDKRQIKESFTKTLGAIHDAGYLHRGIALDHLLVNKGITTVIGFSNSRLLSECDASTVMAAGGALSSSENSSVLMELEKEKRHLGVILNGRRGSCDPDLDENIEKPRKLRKTDE